MSGSITQHSFNIGKYKVQHVQHAYISNGVTRTSHKELLLKDVK
jgi:hypothetical protein